MRINEEITPLEGESGRKILSSGPAWATEQKTLTLKKKKQVSKQKLLDGDIARKWLRLYRLNHYSKVTA